MTRDINFKGSDEIEKEALLKKELDDLEYKRLMKENAAARYAQSPKEEEPEDGDITNSDPYI